MKLNSFFKLVLLATVLLLLNSCYYKPFVKYSLNKKGFKKFSKYEKIAGNNDNPHRDYHVNKYDWNIAVFPEHKKISGEMIIHFTTKSEQNIFLFDLQNKMKIKSFTCSLGVPKIKRSKDLMYLIFDQKISSNTRLKLTINYEGKPANLSNQGPVQWKLDKKNRPWISTQTEGVGPHFIMPCNALLRAEPDSCNINVTVPKYLIAVANGKLKKVIDNRKNDTKTYQYEVTNPINIYNISFNIGNFVKLTKPYTDINGISREIEFQVLDYNKEVADKFYNQTPKIMKQFEKMFGEFPWWNDGCKFVESTFTAMEHQSAIAMGDDYVLNWKEYNLILVHELAHEWWGNNVTGKDYCDVWIHEGLATYSEALFLERIYGQEDYDKRINKSVRSIYNTIPVYKKPDVLYNSWVNTADLDIYDKGALLMHSLRKAVNNDTLFFEALFTVQEDLAEQNISSLEFILKLNKLLEHDYSTLFDWYLNKTTPPVLQVIITKKKPVTNLNIEEYDLSYKWKDELPFYKTGEIEFKTGEENITLTPTTVYQTKIIQTKDINSVRFLIAKSVYYIVDIQYEK